MSFTSKPPKNQNRGDRGAVFVEFAFLIPVLLLLGMGLVEYGMSWKAANDVNAAARDGARAGTSASAYQTADRSVLTSIANSLVSSNQVDGIEKVIIFKPSSASGTIPATCLSMTNSSGNSTTIGSAVGVSGTCNVYGKGQVQYVLNPANASNVASWVNSAGNNCDSGDIDRYWCPATRNHNLSTGSFDYLGVYIKFKHDSVTNFGFGDQTIQRTAIFRLEPMFGGQ